ncbi:hypothetical protein IVB41_12495 [Bradyrhizobium sp. 44]|nr:hypothetical protein [Bradyrhizobium sp. 44]
MRSRFWLGELDPAPPNVTAQDMLALVPDERVQGLHQHCSEEMSMLGGFLPTLYRLHNPERIAGRTGDGSRQRP